MVFVASAGSTSFQTTGRLIEDKPKESLSGTGSGQFPESLED
jgi:hypothetical protein